MKPSEQIAHAINAAVGLTLIVILTTITLILAIDHIGDWS